MSKVLVAGASGYLGRFVVEEFKARNDWARVLVRNPDKLKTAGPFLEPAIDGLVDEVFVGEVTRPATLRGACDGIEIVFSSIGMTRQRERVSYVDVDFRGNKNLLDLALDSAVRKFVYVHGLNAPLLAHFAGMQAKERFVAELRACGLPHAVVCPNGFFNDMSEFLRMAQRGTVYLIGDGMHRINPIHGADLAKVCVDAATNGVEEISVGGPVVYTYRQIADLAFAALGKAPRIRRVPVLLAQFAAFVLRASSWRLSEMARAMTVITQHDFVGPPAGTRTLADYYRELAARG